LSSSGVEFFNAISRPAMAMLEIDPHQGRLRDVRDRMDRLPFI
jgi:hypothetical protein